MKASMDLGKDKLGNLLLSFAIPAIVSLLVSALYNIVDRIFIGQVIGPLGIAGVTAAMPVMMLGTAFGSLLGAGATNLIAIALGKGEKSAAERYLGTAFTAAVVLFAAFSVAGPFASETLLRFFGASEAVMPHAKGYLDVIFIGFVFQGVAMALGGAVHAQGFPRKALFFQLAGCGLNIILDALFVVGLRMGTDGAAIATIISQALGAALIVGFLAGKTPAVRLRPAAFRLDGASIGKIAGLGAAPFALQVLALPVFFVLNRTIQDHGGDMGLAMIGIFNSFCSLIVYLIIGILQGAQPLFGFNYGAGNWGRVRALMRICLVATSVIAALCWAAVQLFPEAILSAFASGSSELLALGMPAMRIYLALLATAGLQFLGSEYFMATGKAPQAMALMLAKNIALVPLVLCLVPAIGIDGLYYAGPGSDLIAAIASGLALALEYRALKRRELALPAMPAAEVA